MQISKILDFSALTGKKKNVGKRSFFALFPPSDPVETNRMEANRTGWCAIRKKVSMALGLVSRDSIARNNAANE